MSINHLTSLLKEKNLQNTIFKDLKIFRRYELKNNLLKKLTKINEHKFFNYINLDPSLKKSIKHLPLNILWNKAYLQGHKLLIDEYVSNNEINIADVCCGSGGFSEGMKLAAKSLGISVRNKFAIDLLKSNLDVFDLNHFPEKIFNEDIRNLIELDFDKIFLFKNQQLSTFLRNDIKSFKNKIDIFLAGPPCEGNSKYNNKTRGFDIRNELYVYAVLIAIALKSKVIIIENVPMVVNAKQNVVDRSLSYLKHFGYKVTKSTKIFNSCHFGVPQARERHFLIASKTKTLEEINYQELFTDEFMTINDAIGNLDSKYYQTEKQNESNYLNKVLDTPPNLQEINKKRVNYLFDNNIYDLPKHMRPKCHQKPDVSYDSVYSRMYGDRPSPTITTGFHSTGRGRYVHPNMRRGLTIREGARLQSFPDSYNWNLSTESRHSLTHKIGDAVPPLLAEIISLIGIGMLKFK